MLIIVGGIACTVLSVSEHCLATPMSGRLMRSSRYFTRTEYKIIRSIQYSYINILHCAECDRSLVWLYATFQKTEAKFQVLHTKIYADARELRFLEAEMPSATHKKPSDSWKNLNRLISGEAAAILVLLPTIWIL